MNRIELLVAEMSDLSCHRAVLYSTSIKLDAGIIVLLHHLLILSLLLVIDRYCFELLFISKRCPTKTLTFCMSTHFHWQALILYRWIILEFFLRLLKMLPNWNGCQNSWRVWSIWSMRNGWPWVDWCTKILYRNVKAWFCAN